MEKSLVEKLCTRNILIIDDDGMITRTLCALLRRSGYFATGAEDGSSAIDEAGETNYDLIIADIRMPVMDGVEAIEKIRARCKEQNKTEVPVVFITGHADDESVRRAKQLGEVLFKPFDTSEFLNRIEKYLD